MPSALSERGHEPRERRARDRDGLGFGTDVRPHRRSLVRDAEQGGAAGRAEADGRRGRPRLVVEFTRRPGLTTHRE